MNIVNRYHEERVSSVIILEGKQHYRIELFFEMGGRSMLSGDYYYKGIHLSVTPVQYSKGMVITRAYSGIRQLLLGMQRFNRKTFDKMAEEMLSSPEKDKVIMTLLETVKTRNRLGV